MRFGWVVGLLLFVSPLPACALEPTTTAVHLAWLKLPQANDPSTSLVSWAQELRSRTSIDVAANPIGVKPEDSQLFYYPFLYLAGDRALPKWSDQAIAQLRQHLLTGGTLLIDNTGRTEASQAFDESIRRELARIFPQPLQRVPPSHVLFRAFYRIDHPVGRRASSNDLEGIRLGNHYAVLYTRNDFAGALARLPVGGYALTVVPGGEVQREQAFRLAVNFVMYALCLDYKDDHSHVMHLLRHRRGARPPPPAADADAP